MSTSLAKLEEHLRRAKPEVQRVFLAHLPHLLDLSPEDIALLKATEPSFDFWNNTADAAYDNL
jgi:hypothetical protein